MYSHISRYSQLADCYYYKDHTEFNMEKDEIANMIRVRLQAHGPQLAVAVGGDVDKKRM